MIYQIKIMARSMTSNLMIIIGISKEIFIDNGRNFYDVKY